jgi:CO dehydrogenase maturation factor
MVILDPKLSNRLIAVCGKGGTGKTVLTTLLAKRVLQQGERKLLVIDADPAMSLPSTFGLEATKTVSQVREKLIREARSAGKAEKQRIAYSLDYMLLEALIETETFSMLVMGRPDSLGCYCPVNELLRDGIETLAANFGAVLIDCEAGIEQISRQVIRSVDTPVIVSDVSARGMQTASVIKKVIESHKFANCRKLGLVINRVRGNEHDFPEFARRTGLELLGWIPEDENIARFDMEARPLLHLPNDSPAFVAAGHILSRLATGTR